MKRFDEIGLYYEQIEMWILRLGLCFVLFVPACAALQRAEREPCPPSDLAKIEAAYVSEALATCRAEGAKTVDACKAFPGIQAKYRAKRAEYVECAR